MQKTVTGGSILIAALLLISAMTPRPGPGIITNLEGVALLGSWLFGFLAYYFEKVWRPDFRINRNLIKILLIFIFGGLIAASFGAIGSLSGRYLTVLYSQLRQTDPLVQSVAEQAVPTGSQFFADYAVIILLAGFGLTSRSGEEPSKLFLRLFLQLLESTSRHPLRGSWSIRLWLW